MTTDTKSKTPKIGDMVFMGNHTWSPVTKVYGRTKTGYGSNDGDFAVTIGARGKRVIYVTALESEDPTWVAGGEDFQGRDPYLITNDREGLTRAVAVARKAGLSVRMGPTPSGRSGRKSPLQMNALVVVTAVKRAPWTGAPKYEHQDIGAWIDHASVEACAAVVKVLRDCGFRVDWDGTREAAGWIYYGN